MSSEAQEQQTILLDGLTAEERSILEDIGKGDDALLQQLYAAEYEEVPVTPEQFFTDPYYLGETGADLYPVVLKDLIEICSNPYREVVLGGSIGWGKCLGSAKLLTYVKEGETFVPTLLQTKEVYSMAAQGKSLYLSGMDIGGNIGPVGVRAAQYSGKKRVVRITFTSGKELIVTPEHPLLGARGFKPALEFSEAECVATARYERVVQSTAFDLTLARWLGMYYADESTVSTNPVRFTKADKRFLETFSAASLALGATKIHASPCKNSKTGVITTVLTASGLMPLARRYGLDKKSKERVIPDEILLADDAAAKEFLRWFWACDGNYYSKSPAKIEVCLSSRKMIDGLAFLLRRFGVHGRIYKRAVKCGGKSFPAYRLAVTGVEIHKFFYQIGTLPTKLETEDDLPTYSKTASNVDIIPIPNRQREGESYYTRARFKAVGLHTHEKWVESDAIFWDRIKSIEDAGEEDVYDFDVPATRNFVANGIIVHNSTVVEFGMAWMLYETLCLRSPQRSFGLMEGSTIVLCNLSVSYAQARKAIFSGLSVKLRQSKFFKDVFPYDPSVTSELRFPKHITIFPGASTDHSILGLNVIGGAIDECVNGSAMIRLGDGTDARADSLVGKSFYATTFDFSRGMVLSAPAFVELSTVQKVFELEFDDNRTTLLSGDHPVAIACTDGTFELKLVRDLIDGDMALTFDHEVSDGQKAYGSNKGEIAISAEGLEAFGRASGQDQRERQDASQPRGMSSNRIIRPESSSLVLSLRSHFDWVRKRWASLSDSARFFGELCGRLDSYYRGQATGLHERSEGDYQEGSRNAILYGARVGLRGLDGKTALVRLRSKKSLGEQQTYKISVPRYEVVVVDGVVTHNSNFMRVADKKDVAGRFGKGSGSYDKAQTLYNAMLRRMKSRFLRRGQLPGKLFTLSSAQYPDDFVDRKIKEAIHDSDIFVRSYALWEVKPKGDYSEQTFEVEVGSDVQGSRILTGNEDPETIVGRVIAVPLDFRKDFGRNIEDSIRDIAGISTLTVDQFIRDFRSVVKCVERSKQDKNRIHAFTADETNLEDGHMLYRRAYLVQDEGGVKQLRYRPGVPRVAHIDPSLSGDATGIAVGHIADMIKIKREDAEGNVTHETCPVIFYDLLLRITPPQGREIQLDRVRSVLYQLIDDGMPIKLVTMDTFQCLAGNTLVNTDRGLLPLAEVVVGDVVHSRSGARAVTNKWCFGEQETIKICTKHGDEIEGTGRHRIEVQEGWTTEQETEFGLTRQPVWVWRRLGEVREGDVVRMVDAPVTVDAPEYPLVASKFVNTNNRGGLGDSWRPPKTLTPALAEFFGLLWGDGDVGRDGVRLTVTEDEYPDALRIIQAVFGNGFDPAFRLSAPDARHGSTRIYSRGLVRWLKANNLVKPFVPEPVLRGSRAAKAAFLRGLFAADGSVDTRDGGVSFSTKHLKLARQVMILLRTEFGVSSDLTTVDRSKYPGYPTDSPFQYIVRIRGSRKKFLDAVGFSYEYKEEQLREHVAVRGRRIFSRVESITSSKAVVYDIEVQDDPSYIANGFVSHNSAESLQQFERRGLVADRLSVDRDTAAYDILRTALYDQRVDMYAYEPALYELRRLEHDRKRRKVDHPDGGSKDVSDAMAGVAFTLTTYASRLYRPDIEVITV